MKPRRSAIMYWRTVVIGCSLLTAEIQDLRLPRQIELYRDSLALNVLNRCVINSNCVARWLLDIGSMISKFTTTRELIMR